VAAAASIYRSVVDYCGFDGMATTVESGANGINHVLVGPRAGIPVETGARRALTVP
jgi:hypothetical protein